MSPPCGLTTGLRHSTPIQGAACTLAWEA